MALAIRGRRPVQRAVQREPGGVTFEAPLHNAAQHRVAGSTLQGLVQNYYDTYGIMPGWGARYQGYMSIPGAWRASVMLSDLFASTPWHTYRIGPGGNQVRTPRNAAILESPAGSVEVPSRVWGSWALDYLWEGNAVGIYAARDSEGRPTAALPVPASSCWVHEVTADTAGDLGAEPGRRKYAIGNRIFDESEIFHVKGPCEPNARRGMGVLEMETTNRTGALALAAKLASQAGAISDHGVPTGLLKPANPEATPEDLKITKANWLESQRSRTIAVLLPNVAFEPLAWNPEEMQLVEARKFSLSEQELIFGLPVGWLGGATSSRTYSNIEQDAVNLLKFSVLMGMYGQFEAVLTSLIPPGQSAKANRDAILRSDTLTRYQAHTIATGGRPWMTPDDVRGIEDMELLGGTAAQLEASPVAAGPATGGEGGGNATNDGAASDAAMARFAAETAQKAYLAVGPALTSEEARDLVRRSGANLAKEES